MNQTIDVLKKAEEAMDECSLDANWYEVKDAIRAEIARLEAQPVQEPVEYHVENVYKRGDKFFAWIGDDYVEIQPVKQEPVAEGYMKCPACGDRGIIRKHFTELERMLIEDAFEKCVQKAAPVEREWVDLTDDEIVECFVAGDEIVSARAVIVAFKEKNK